jgi:hypothetical protein
MGWDLPLSYAVIATMHSDLGLRRVNADSESGGGGGAGRCARPSELGAVVTCPHGAVAPPATEMVAQCAALGKPCPDGCLCLCRPCQASGEAVGSKLQPVLRCAEDPMGKECPNDMRALSVAAVVVLMAVMKLMFGRPAAARPLAEPKEEDPLLRKQLVAISWKLLANKGRALYYMKQDPRHGSKQPKEARSPGLHRSFSFPP